MPGDAPVVVVVGLLHATGSVQREAQAVVGVIDIAANVLVGIRAAGEVAVLVVGVTSRQVEPGVGGRAGVGDFQHTAAQVVVGVGRGGAVGVCDAECVACAVMAVLGHQIQARIALAWARRVDGLLHQFALGVVDELGHVALGVGDAELLALGAVGVGGDEVQARRVNGAGDDTVASIKAKLHQVAVGVCGGHQTVGVVKGAGAAGQRAVCGGLVAIFVVFKARGAAFAVGDRQGLAQSRARGADRDALWRSDCNAALGLVVGVESGAQLAIGLRDGAVKGVIGCAAVDVQRVGAGNDAAQAVVLGGSPTAIGVAAALDPAKGIVYGDGDGVQDRSVGHDAGAQTPVVVGAGFQQAAARAETQCVLNLLAEGVVAVTVDALDAVGRDDRIGHGGQGARGVVNVAGAAVVGRTVHVGDGLGQCAGDQPARECAVESIDGHPVAQLDTGLHLAEGVVAGLSGFAECIDGVGQAAVGIVIKQGLVAVLIGGAGAPPRRVVAVGHAVLRPDLVDLRLGLRAGEQGAAFA